MNILKNKTKSICPECFKEIDARIIEDSGKVFMIKTCEIHGEFKVMIEKNVSFYKKIMNKPLQKRIPYSSIMVPITSRCNLNCKICYYPKREGYDIPLDEYEKVISTFEGKKVRLSGGEPTLRENLDDIIKCTSKHGKISFLTTNGLTLADPKLVKRLKMAGLNTVFFSFNGFKKDTSLEINSSDILGLKLKALQNLKKEGVEVILSTLLHRGLNETELKDIFEFVLEQHPFISEWRIRTSNLIGRHVTTQPFFLSELFDMVADIMQDKLSITKQQIMNSFIRNKSKVDCGPCRFYIDLYKKNITDKMFNKVFYGNNPPHLKIVLRSWPNKYNMDLEEMKRCPSSFLVKDGRLFPFCYALVMGEKEIEL